MRVHPVVVGLAASALLLSGCAQAPAIPPGPSVDEVQAILDAQNEDWWNQMFPTEPMPDTAVVRSIPPTDTTTVNECVDAAHLEGVTVTGNGIQIDGDTEEFNRVYFVCLQQYPVLFDENDDLGYYTTEQLDYLYTYFTDRLVPCLELLGYSVGNSPSRASIVGATYLTWVPYYAMVPQPTTAEEWQRIDVRCPPPPFGMYWRTGIDEAVGG